MATVELTEEILAKVIDGNGLKHYNEKIQTQLENKLEETDISALRTTVSSHTANTTVHITSAERTKWNKVVTDLTNYYTKSSTYSKTEVDSKISAIPKFSISVVETLPTSSISATTVYLKKTSSDDTKNAGNLYTEYIYVNSAWEELGTQKLDISSIQTTLETKISAAESNAKTYTDSKEVTISKSSTNGAVSVKKGTAAATNVTVYTHPTKTSSAIASGLYKIAVDTSGHVSGTTAVAKADLTALGVLSAVTATTSGSGEAVTSVTASGGALTVTKGNIHSSTITADAKTSTTTAAPAFGETFTALSGVTRDTKGHVTNYTTKTVTIPSVSTIPRMSNDEIDALFA